MRPTILFISQVFPPDPASVGQHMSDAADEMGARGFRVVVLTADRGYDDPTQRYPRRERKKNVEIVRLPFSSFGKASLAHRVLGGVSLCVQSLIAGLCCRNLRAVLVTTAPPFAGVVGLIIAKLRRVPLKVWVMDVNPDQVVALGHRSERALSVRMLRRMNQAVYSRAADIVVLDTFMRRRLDRYTFPPSTRIHVLPPWPLDEVMSPIDHACNPFRDEHGLAGKFVVMYSGNHGAHPLDTVLAAAAELEHDPRIVFMFVGGGAGKRAIEQRPLRNTRSLPYQPRERLRASLSAADLHIVTLGNQVVGINHPCKVYGALAVGRPILFVGPSASHIGEILRRRPVGWHAEHGDVAGTVCAVREAATMNQREISEMGANAQELVRTDFDKPRLQSQFGDIVARDLEIR